ncbi:hypothetical protein [Brachyspira hyodysenteriae]|uniref:hypothetical protein n=2 Tax=Brachyspira hyodysenteriae TaxID=159 RepID=UPI0022CE354A|nr:hypothetical protein [Brachyspira hyodysenteriae]MCZ9887229.1 hypothetical protein [Brachyspira hyodysenteriae]
MKKIFITIFSFLLFFVNTLFSQFDASIYAPLSFTLTFPMLDTKNVNVNNLKGNGSFSAGVIGNFGHKFSINDGKYSISVLTEIGYYRQTFSASFHYSSIEFKDTLAFDTLLVGVMPKFNIDLKDLLTSISPNYNIKTVLSIGIGFGMKIPFGGSVSSYIDGTGENQKLSFNDINKNFTYPIIPYIKLQFDDYFYFNEHVAFLFGVNITYDFGIFYDINYIDSQLGSPLLSSFINNYGFSSLEIALNFGIKFGN